MCVCACVRVCVCVCVCVSDEREREWLEKGREREEGGGDLAEGGVFLQGVIRLRLLREKNPWLRTQGRRGRGQKRHKSSSCAPPHRVYGGNVD